MKCETRYRISVDYSRCRILLGTILLGNDTPVETTELLGGMLRWYRFPWMVAGIIDGGVLQWYAGHCLKLTDALICCSRTAMSRRYVLVLFGGFVAVCAGSLHTAGGQETATDRADETFFETRIRPVLAEACVQCHGPDVASGELRLDSREALLKGGEHGPAVVPGDAEQSLLILALKHDDDQSVQMPPEEPLADEAIADLTAWIAAGAKWPETEAVGPDSPTAHWAFQPLADVPVPEDPTGWGEDPIDRFVSAARHQQGLRPNGTADKHVLLGTASPGSDAGSVIRQAVNPESRV